MESRKTDCQSVFRDRPHALRYWRLPGRPVTCRMTALLLTRSGKIPMPLCLKYLITADLVVRVSEVARHSDRLGALIASLPMFALFPLMMERFAFWPSMGLSVVITLVSFLIAGLVARQFGVFLW